MDEALSSLKLTQEHLGYVKSRMRAGLEAGLKSQGPSPVKMLPAYVYRTPDGTGQKVIHGNILYRLSLLMYPFAYSMYI